MKCCAHHLSSRSRPHQNAVNIFRRYQQRRTSKSFSMCPLTPPGVGSQISIPFSMNLTDPLVGVGASEGSSPDGEGALLQISKSETTHKSTPPLIPHRKMKKGDLGQRSQCLWIRISGLAPEILSCASNSITSTYLGIAPGPLCPQQTACPHPPLQSLCLKGAKGEERRLTQKQEDHKVMIHSPFTAQHLSGKTRPGD